METALRRAAKTLNKNKALLLLALPGLLCIFVFSYVPMFGIVIAFKNYNAVDGIWGSPWIGLRNFEFLFNSQDAWRITYNTLALNFSFIAFGTVAAVALAIVMNEIKSRWMSSIYQSVLFLPHLLSWVLVGYLVFALLAASGLVNHVLAAFDREAVSWYTEPAYWPFILTITVIWKQAGYTSIIFLASIIGISPEYYEAAKIDGASKLQQIRYITLPCLVPVITIMTLLSIGRIFYADFGLFYNVTQDIGQLYPTTDVIDTYVFRMLRTVGDIGMASAAGVYQSIVGFLLVLGSNYFVRKVNADNALF
ncbi:ABC transporter permease [Paenibacillus chartarius]|uniref:ABC transporter permease n=1 Tax=Paenibacillus chartarius TaxID=747481 RepID=A0ABV6DQ29_9BACL